MPGKKLKLNTFYNKYLLNLFFYQTYSEYVAVNKKMNKLSLTKSFVQTWSKSSLLYASITSTLS